MSIQKSMENIKDSCDTIAKSLGYKSCKDIPETKRCSSGYAGREDCPHSCYKCSLEEEEFKGLPVEIY